MVSWGKQKGVIRVFRAKKAVVQVLLIAAGIAMVCFGALRGEAGAVLSKADRKSTRLNSSHTQKSRMPSSA